MNVSAAAKRVLARFHEQIDGPEKVVFQRLRREGRVTVGHGTYGYPTVRTFVLDDANLIIGKYSSLAHGATFLLGGEHPVDRVTTYPCRIMMGLEGAGHDGFPRPTQNTVVGSDAWVGANALILSGRRIGDGAVVAAGAVVTRDVPPYAIVGGNPARVIRYRHTEEQCAALLQIRWWDWSPDRIREAVPLLAGQDIEAFLNYAKTAAVQVVP